MITKKRFNRHLNDILWLILVAAAAMATGGIARAQSSVQFYLAQFAGTTNDTTINIVAKNNPIIYNGQFYWWPANGTNLSTTNGFAAVKLIPGQYNVSLAGVPQSWTLTVTNSVTPLNAAGLTTSTLIYSGINSVAGNVVTSDNHGNYGINADTNGAAQAATNALGTAAFSAASAYDAAGAGSTAAYLATNSLGSAAFQPSTQFLPASNAVANVSAPTTSLSGAWLLVDQLNGNDSTGVTNNYALPVSNLETAVWMIQSNAYGGGAIITVPGQTVNLDTIQNSMVVSNNCFVNLMADGTTFYSTNQNLVVWTFNTNSTYIEHDAVWNVGFPAQAGNAYLYHSAGASGPIDFEIYGGTSYDWEDGWFTFTMGNGGAHAAPTDAAKFPRFALMNHTCIGTWDLAFIGAGPKTQTNLLCQYIGDTFDIYNNVNEGPGNTIHGVSTGGFSLFKDCVFNLTNAVANFGAVCAVLPAHFALVNCTFNVANPGGNGGATNIVFSANTRQYYFPELYNCACGTNCWITGDGTGTMSYLNIRTKDGLITQHQVWP